MMKNEEYVLDKLILHPHLYAILENSSWNDIEMCNLQFVSKNAMVS